MESSRRYRRQPPCSLCRAQRLAASMESSHHGTELPCALLSMCSTPCGINGILTQLIVSYEPRRCMCAQRLAASMESSPAGSHATMAASAVLNALRHQWNPHTDMRHRAASTLIVLNALRHQWNPHRARSWYRDAAPSVLNALRHQWNPHIDAAGSTSACSHVLNALRHQWNPHSYASRTQRHGYRRCSTPCGINGILTRACCG